MYKTSLSLQNNKMLSKRPYLVFTLKRLKNCIAHPVFWQI